ncbi:MAG TPA: ATP-binding protein, partial [Salinimicrobium sp.]|nr:ATP-binding protein [Salinimicrobium sp.]
GMRKKDIRGMKLMDIVPFIHPLDRAVGLDFHQNLIKASDRDILEIEFRLKAKNSKWEWYNAVGKVFMRTKRGNVGEYMLLLRNIDKQMRTQKALSQAEKLSIKGEVAQTLAHELRNPLASIGMAADILKTKMPKDPDSHVENYIQVIKRSAKVLNKLVTDLLTSSNYSPAILEKNCLAMILEDTLKMAGDRIYLSGIKVEKDYSGNYFINADDEKLKIALLNLIVNASEAMEPQKGILNLSIAKKDNYFNLKIEDNGCGMNPEQLGKLFDAFYTQKEEGLGVGLSSVKSILEEHNAKISVTSEPSKGTIFNLSFHCYENNERS